MSVHLRNFLQDRAIARIDKFMARIPSPGATRWYQRPQWRAVEVIALSAPQRFVIPKMTSPALRWSERRTQFMPLVRLASRTWLRSWPPWRAFGISPQVAMPHRMTSGTAFPAERTREE